MKPMVTTKDAKKSLIERGDEIIIRPVTDAYIDGLKGTLPTRGKTLQALRAEKREERER
jgi:hypothetical protein